MNFALKSYSRLIFIVLIISSIIACRSQDNSLTKRYLQEEIKAKKHIDQLASDSNAVIVYVKTPGNDSLQLVKDGKFPDSVELTYNIIKDTDGKVALILESPTIESEDCDISYLSYFDKSGKLFAFERVAGFFNSECTTDPEDSAHEDLIKYYDNSFNVIDSKYTLTDSKNRKLQKSQCQFNYDYPYTIIRDLDTYLKTKHINTRL